jgi:phosphoserine aminotransferase
VLPLPVLEEIRNDLPAMAGVGMSALEISHRSKVFGEILADAESDIRVLLRVPNTHHILFLQGGASLQFSMVPMNFLGSDRVADYLLTDYFSKKAMAEAQKFGRINVAASTESENFNCIPTQNELNLDPEAAYVHFTTNNTVFGTQWRVEPQVGEVPLIADATSDILSRPIEIGKYGLVYASAQKNLGISGLTVVIIRDDLLERIPEGLAATLDYRTHVTHKSMYHTPPTFPIYVMRLVLKWLKEQGGLNEVARRNQEKAELLYDVIDSSNFYSGHAIPENRSLMNVTFRLPSEDLTERFVKEASHANLIGLQGHRSIGGCRASLYSALPREGVESLVSFMREFEADSSR